MCITFFIGASVLELFSISIPSLRLGGGIIICAIGFNMLFPKPESMDGSVGQDSIALVPLTIPYFAARYNGWSLALPLKSHLVKI